MQQKTVELWVGIFVAAGFAALAMLAFKVANLSSTRIERGYSVKAEFDNIGSLKERAPVTMAGVRIGRVATISFDKETYRARVVMAIDPHYNSIPKDSSASILTAGLLGEQYVGLEPGGSNEYLKNGDQIQITQSALVLEQIIGQFLYNKAANPPASGAQTPPPQ